MIKKLQQMWKAAAASPKEGRGHDVSLAVAALMVEVMRMDGHLDEAEHSTMMVALEKRFGLSYSEIHALIEQAADQVDKALDLHQFTSIVVKGFSTPERVEILTELWAVAMADGTVDPYEEQIIRRMADLLGIHHTQFIEAKLAAQLQF
ncbi:MAG: hypothetical protein AUJ57_05535 [Zetaproteobacteria bacterium CG1_02_53_45]|nr:MAG: hypothetical protein AUJ57_05535 [Zetaproteobacteria bacterium CG1_02_53_45]